MSRIFYLAVLVVLIAVPVFAQEEAEVVQPETSAIDLGQASDEDVAGALEESSDIEFASEEPAEESAVVAEESAVEEDATVAEEATEEEAIAEEQPEEETATVAAAPEADIPDSIRNNQFVRESRRLAKLAEDTYDYGDYDASTVSAEEAIHYAILSDVYVAIALAKSRIDWAVESGASKQHPVEFKEAETWYNESLTARDAEQWETAIEAANKVVDIIAYMSAPEGTYPLPARYTVRSWLTVRDCFWNISGRSWVYGNPHLWRVLYNANKSKLPYPDNPNIIEPGMVLDIPSIKGEFRQGEWSSGRTYGSMPK